VQDVCNSPRHTAWDFPIDLIEDLLTWFRKRKSIFEENWSRISKKSLHELGWVFARLACSGNQATLSNKLFGAAALSVDGAARQLPGRWTVAQGVLGAICKTNA